MKHILLRLYKAVLVSSTNNINKHVLYNKIASLTIPSGFLFSEVVVNNTTEKELINLIPIIEQELGLSAIQLNSTLHKSWKKVKTASLNQLVAEQIVHYISTYGFQAMDMYDDSTIYIPHEKLNIPELTDKIKITLINGYTKEQIKEKTLSLLNSGIALKEDTVKDVVHVTSYFDVSDTDIENIKNKEVKIALYDKLNKVPVNNVEFLRYVLYKSIDKTLLIKNTQTIELLKASTFDFESLFKQYNLVILSEIFNRFKPLFLAIKKHNDMATYINDLSRLSKTFHKPLPEDYLNTITAKIKNNIPIDNNKILYELKRNNTFRKIRLAYALKYRTKNNKSILYKIRNGKSYATDFEFNNNKLTEKILKLVTQSIVTDISKNVKGKKIYIPKNITYTLPATEKQFTGDIPSGSYVQLKKDMIFGVHWENLKHKVIDLDLSIINQNNKYGWDGSYRSDIRDILFSGDITSAPLPNGATELFYVQKQSNGQYIVMLNFYNMYDESKDVPFKIIVAKKDKNNQFKNNYMVDPNSVVAITKSIINKQQKTLGLVVTTEKSTKFYFSEQYIGAGCTSSGVKYVQDTKDYMFNFFTDTISLNDILVEAGAILVNKNESCDINLAPESLEKDKIISLIKHS